MKTSEIHSDSSVDNRKKVQSSIVHRAKRFLNPSKENKGGAKTDAEREITIFLVDDDLLFLKALKHSILNKSPRLKIKNFQTGEACLQQMTLKPDIVILDYYLNSEVPYAWNGIDILKEIKKINSKTKVIMLSAQDRLDIAVKCIDNGSFDYISKSESAFVKINNILTNIVEDADTKNKSMHPYQIIGIIVIIILMACLLIKSNL